MADRKKLADYRDERVVRGKQAVSPLPHSQEFITHNSLLMGNQINVMCDVTMNVGLWEYINTKELWGDIGNYGETYGIMGRQRELWGDRGNYGETNNSAGTLITLRAHMLYSCIADAVIFVFNVSNYFRNGEGLMRGNIKIPLIDLRNESYFFLLLLNVSINKMIITASNLII